jgi:hypothetical protein
MNGDVVVRGKVVIDVFSIRSTHVCRCVASTNISEYSRYTQFCSVSAARLALYAEHRAADKSMIIAMRTVSRDSLLKAPRDRKWCVR